MRRGDLKAAAQAEKLMDFALALGFKIHSHCLRHSDGVSMLTLAVMLRQPGAKELSDGFVMYESYLPADVEFLGKCDPHEPAIKDMARLMLLAGATGTTLLSNESAATVNVCRKCGRVIVRSAEDACKDPTPRQCLRWTIAEVGDDGEVRELIGPTPLIPDKPPELHDARAQADTAIRNLDDLGNLRRASFKFSDRSQFPGVFDTREDADKFSKERLVPRFPLIPQSVQHLIDTPPGSPGPIPIIDFAPAGSRRADPLRGVCKHCGAFIRVNSYGPQPFWEIDQDAERAFAKANPHNPRGTYVCGADTPSIEHEPIERGYCPPERFEGPIA